MKPRPLLVLALTLGVLAAAAPAGASHRWESFHWGRTRNPFTLKLLDSVTPAWDPYLGPVSADWSQSSVLDTRVVPADGSRKMRRQCPVPNGRIRVCNLAYGWNGWLGIAEIWLTRNHITAARVRLNDTYYALAQYNNPYARRHVMCQEIGHALGLDHQYDVTCMNDVAGTSDPTYVAPNQHDLDELAAVYSHADGSSTIGSRTLGGEVRVSHHGDVTKLRWVYRARSAR